MALNDYDPQILSAAKQWTVDPQLLKSVMAVESGGNQMDPNNPRQVFTSKAGAQGIMQFTPQTAKQYGVDVTDPTSAINGAAHYVSDLLHQYGSPDVALDHYSGNTPGYGAQVVAAYRSVPPPVAPQQPATPVASGASTTAPQQPTAASSTQDAFSSLSPDEQQLLLGKPAPAPTPKGSAVAAQSTPAITGISPSEAKLYTGAPPATRGAASGAALAGVPPADATLALGPGATGEMPIATPAQVQAFQTGLPAAVPGIVHGARETVNPLLETASNVGNWAANKLGIPGLQTARTANDIAEEQAFGARYGGNDPQSQMARLTSGVTQAALPFAVGGAGALGLRAGLEAAGAPGAAAFLTGQGGVGQAGIAGLGNRLASGAASGAYQGLLTGGAPGALTGGLWGGTVLPAAGGVANWVGGRVNAAGAALNKIREAMIRDGASPAQMQQALDQLGNLGTLADVGGANLRQLAEGVANTPGPGQQAAVSFLTKRAEGQTQRLDDAVRLATGATGSAFSNTQDLITARSAAAAPAYAAAFANTKVTPADAQALDRFINTPIGQRALQNGVANMRLESIANNTPFKLTDYGVTENPDGSYALAQAPGGTPNLRLYDAVKRGYDVLAENFRDPVTNRLNLSGTVSIPGVGGQVSGRAVQSVRQAYTGALRSMFPEYGNALDAWAGPSSAMDAIGMGQRALSRASDETAATVAQLSPSEKQMFQVGVAQSLLDRIERTPDEADATRRIFGNDQIRGRIAAAFGGEATPAFQQFRQTAESEATFAGTSRQLLQGSPTARRTAAIAAAQGAAPAAHLIGPFPTVVSPAAIWRSGEDRDAAVHVEFEAAVGVHVVPDQRRDGDLIARREPVGPMGPGEDLLQHEGVDKDHAVLEQVQAQHAEFVVLATIAAELAALGKEHEVVRAVPMFNDIEPIVDFPP
jgi:Transglycosylase SLT domain